MKQKTTETPVALVQTAPGKRHPFSAVEQYTPLLTPETRLYASLYEGIPIISAAIARIIRLVGGFSVQCPDAADTKGLAEFLRTVPFGSCAKGIDVFVASYLRQMLLYGTGVAEIVLDQSRMDIAGLYQAGIGDVVLREHPQDPMQVQVCRREAGQCVPAKRQDLLLVTPLDPDPERPFGTSLLFSLPFVSSVLLKIYQSEKVNFDRVGNLRFAVTCKPSEGSVGNRERAKQIAQEWSKAMRGEDGVSDFIALGDVDIKVIGADNQVLDCEIPARQMTEQIVARLGLPPFLLGLSWSTSERMSTQQADLLTSELEAYRRALEPVIRRICTLWLALHGASEQCTVVWNDISLQDLTEQAKAELYRAQADKIRAEMGKGE